MPALNFSAQFADAVASGEKTQTIRKHRKVPIKAGDTLYLFTGQRTKRIQRLGTVVCRSVRNIAITETAIWVNGEYCSYEERHRFANLDGFTDEDDFRAWFRDHYGLPFRGVLIVWDQQEEERV